MKHLIPQEIIERKIFLIRGQRVMLDSDLAKLYCIGTKVLNQAVKRNIDRFPQDFMFSLTREEIRRMSQFVTSLKFYKNVNVFTEQGVAMLSSVLRSKRAIQVNIAVMRAFVKLRHILSEHKIFEMKLRELESKLENHDVDIRDIFEALRQLMGLADTKKTIKGFAQQ